MFCMTLVTSPSDSGSVLEALAVVVVVAKVFVVVAEEAVEVVAASAVGEVEETLCFRTKG